MNRSWRGLSLLAVLAAVSGRGALQAQSFSLSFSAPTAVIDDASSATQYVATGQLTTSGLGATDPGAQGWSLSMSASGGGAIVDVTTAGTIVDSLFNGGFNKTELTAGPGNEGAVSAIVLSFTTPVTLPPTGTVDLVRLTVEATVGECGIDESGDPACLAPVMSRVYYVNGRTGAGQPVDNKITYNGQTVIPTLADATTSICPPCRKPLAFHLDVPGATAGPPAGLVVPFSVDVAPGAGMVPVNTELTLTSNLPEQPPDESFPANLGGAQGWSISILAEPCFNIASATTAGTEADTVANGGYWDGGFNKTQVVDPSKPENAGQQGAVSAIVLSFTNGNTLPPMGDFLVLKVNGSIDASAVTGPGVCTSTCTVRPTTPEEAGLVGAGQPVKTAVTVAGGTRNPSVSGAAITLCGAREARFVRGNANDDLKVDIADPIWILNELFRSGAPTVCQDAADANDDGVVDTSDAVYLITYLFGDFTGGSGVAGPAPPAPFGSVPGDCGSDPTEDTLTCTESQSSC